jgi:thymidine kinase
MSLEIVIGPMFSGKSTYALSYVRRQRAIGKNVLIVKPDIDKRYSNEDVLITHDKDQIPCMMWDTEYELNPSLPSFLNSDSIVIEEAQFFKGLQNAVMWLLKAHRKDILVVGLDGDAQQNPFGEILDCIPYAKSVLKLIAYCSICRDGTLGLYTKRKNPENITEQICVGGADMYDAVCLNHL